MLLSKSHYCPYRKGNHENLAFAEYTDGYWCYSCNKGKFINSPFAVREPRIQNTSSIALPKNYVSNPRQFPPHILSWLYQYYVFEDLINKYNILYIPYTEFTTNSGGKFSGDSLLYPLVNGNNEIIGYQRRFFPEKQLFSKNVNKHSLNVDHGHDTVVLVEDYLSCIRVGEIEDCICLFGTSIDKNTFTFLVNSYTNIILWLDGDEPGQQAANKIIRKLEKEIKLEVVRWAFLNTEPRIIRNIKTELDPKCYSDSEIRSILSDKNI